MLKEHHKAPDFCLQGVGPDGNDHEFCLSGLLNKGRDIILYFYPKDDTPGCTVEACDFRDNFNRIGDRAIVVGVSPDDVSSHRKFKDKHGLNFILLSDLEHKVLETYGAWGEIQMYGRKTMGTLRSTYLIGPDGKIKKHWTKVKAKGHVDTIIETLEAGTA